MSNLIRIQNVDDVKPNDIVLLHCTTDSKHLAELRFTFAPCRVIERVQNTQRADAIPVLDQFGRFDWIVPTSDECYLLPTPAPASTYDYSSDSPLDEMLRAWIADSDVLRCYSVETLDEMRSCVHSLRQRPVHADDKLLADFGHALDRALYTC